MTEEQKKELLDLYDKIESTYRRYQYAKEMSEKSFNDYLKLVAKLPVFNKEKGVFENENK